jgi:hypothetical protein
VTLWVYVAGAYTGPTAEHVEANVGAALDAGDRLEDAGVGIRVSIPHLSHYRNQRKPRHYEEWMARCFDEIRRCHAVLRLPDESPGGIREGVFMRGLGRPVFHSEADVIAWARRTRIPPVQADATPAQRDGDSRSAPLAKPDAVFANG